MKKKISAVIVMIMLLTLSVSSVFAKESSSSNLNPQGNRVVTVSKEEAQEFRRQAGLPEDPDVAGGYIVYSTPQVIPPKRGGISPLEIGGNEYYIKNKTSLFKSVDYSNPYLPGASSCSPITLSTSASFSYSTSYTAGVTLSASFISANFGVTIGQTLSITNTGTGSVPANKCGTLKGYPRYQHFQAELWENDPLFNDYKGIIKTTQLESIYFELKLS